MQHKALPLYIEPAKLAESGEKVQGSLPLTKMPRLVEMLRGGEGEAVLKLDISKNIQGVIQVAGNVCAEVSLQCQRCLQDFQQPVQASWKLSPVKTEAHAKALPEGQEALFLDEEGRLMLAEFLEDELLLALPLVAKHSEACVPESAMQYGEEIVETKENPFQVLNELKGTQ